MTCLAVAAGGDPVLDGVAASHPRWHAVAPGDLADLAVTLDGAGCRVAGDPVRAVYWAPPVPGSLADSFVPEEQQFVTQELVSMWSTVASLPRVVCNLPAEGFHSFHVSQWQHLLVVAQAAGIRIAPWSGAGPALWLTHCGGQPIPIETAGFPGAVTVAPGALSWWWTAGARAFAETEGSDPSAAEQAATAFAGAGFGMVRFALDADGAMVFATIDLADQPMSAARASAAQAFLEDVERQCGF